jgi:hypothetical protein
MEKQELQNALAAIAETLITTQRNLVTISRSLSAVRLSVGELHPGLPVELERSGQPQRGA